MKPKIIVILGATSTGKSDLAVQIAKKYNGEIISADSRQVYKGLDLGTGKITKKEMAGVPHHLLDVVNPKSKFTVTQYQNLTNATIVSIVKRGKIPIITGGTGFYIDAVVNNIVFPEVPPNEKLRKKLALLDARQLMLSLKKLDPIRAKTIDSHNKVRIIRAIEIAKHLGKVPHLEALPPSYDFIKIGLVLDDKKLKEKIKTRLLDRIKRGMLKEAQNLHNKGLSWRRMRELGLEYRYMALYLTHKITKAEMLEQLINEINHYAKRQTTWFKRNVDITWFNPKDVKKIEKYIKENLKK